VHSLKYSVDGNDITIEHSELAYLVDEIGIAVPNASHLARHAGKHAINPLGVRIPIYAANVDEAVSLRPAHDAFSLKFCTEQNLPIQCSIGEYGIIETGKFPRQDFRKLSERLRQDLQDRGVLIDSQHETGDVRTCRGTGYRLYRRAIPGLFIRSSVL